MKTNRIDKTKREAIALSKLLFKKYDSCGSEEWERMQYLRTKLLTYQLRNK